MSAVGAPRVAPSRAAGPRVLRRLRRSTAGWLLLLHACAGATPGTDVPEKARPDAEALPPRLGAKLPWSFSATAGQGGQARLDNGLSLRVLERRALPLLELRLVIASGSASDGDRPGVAALTLGALELMAELAADREPGSRAEALGASLRLQARRDACVLALTLPSAALREGLALLASLSLSPSWAPAAFETARARELARLHSSLQRPGWLAEHALFAELFRSAPRQHPYAHASALPSELQRLTLEGSKSWHERHFSPRNASLLAVGDVSLAELQAAAQRAFGGWQGQAVEAPAPFTPQAPTRLKTLLVQRAGASRSELRVATLGPARIATDWPAFAAAQWLLGGDDSSRLRRELTRRGELAVDLRSFLVPVAQGATPLVIEAATSTERTGLTLAALLDSFGALAEKMPSQRELRAARAQLAASTLRALDTSASAAELLLAQQLSGLSSKAADELSSQLALLGPKDVERSARRYLQGPPVVVVVGDAAQLVTPLSRFGQVHVLDPQRDFQTERVVSQDPTAPLEGPVAAPAPDRASFSPTMQDDRCCG